MESERSGSTSAIRSYVLESLAEFVELETEEVDADADIFRTYGIDSLQLVELASGLERRFGLAELELEEFRSARSANEIADRVNGLRDGSS